MATSFDKIIDQALVIVNDYKLSKLYNQSQDSFQKWCDGFLFKAVPKFVRCKQSLSYNTETREFDSDLTDTEISILSDFWVLVWWERETNDSAQIANKLQVSSGFTSHSAAQNLKEKINTINTIRERVYQSITDYLLENLDDIDI